MAGKASVSKSLWTGETGRLLSKISRDARLVYFYLRTCPDSESTGLYLLELSAIERALGLTESMAKGHVSSLSEVGLAHYDAPNKLIFVVDMAADEFGPRLKVKDNRVKSVRAAVNRYSHSPLAHRFYERYGKAYHLHEPKSAAPVESVPPPSTPQELQQQVERELAELGFPGCDPVPETTPDGMLFPAGEPDDYEKVFTPRDVVDYWNASKATSQTRLTPGIAAKIRTRLQDQEWPWMDAIDQLPVDNREGFTWQPDLNWLIKNDENADKLASGKYHQNGSAARDPRGNLSLLNKGTEGENDGPGI